MCRQVKKDISLSAANINVGVFIYERIGCRKIQKGICGMNINENSQGKVSVTGKAAAGNENMKGTLQETHFNGKLFTEPDKGYSVDTSDFLVKKVMEKLTTAVIVPSAEDGAFMIELLRKRLQKIRYIFDYDLTIYENLSLLTLSVVYALTDNEIQRGICLLNVYEAFKEDYFACVNELREIKAEIGLPKIAKQTLKISEDVLNSAKLIISSNIRSGNLAERKIYGDEAAFFYVWETVESNRRKNIEVCRRKYTLAELMEKEVLKERQKPVKLQVKTVQPALFDIAAEGADAPVSETPVSIDAKGVELADGAMGVAAGDAADAEGTENTASVLARDADAKGTEKSAAEAASSEEPVNAAFVKKQSVMLTEIYEEMGLSGRDE